MPIDPRARPPANPPGDQLADKSFLAEGTVLERKYRVIRVVAEGGFSVVHEGEHMALRIPIAIKVLRSGPGAPAPDDLAARFAFEAQTIARLTHPDIVRVLDTGVFVSDEHPAGVPWIVLEWLVGETLRQHLAARRGAGGRRPSECLSLLGPVFAAIAHAHGEGIAHRDIKPSNIMLARTQALSMAGAGVSAKVLDFGIAKIVGADARSGGDATEGSMRAFSRSHAAPEQLAGSRTGRWTDVHALALILTELLTDQPPYSASDGFEAGQLVFDPARPTPGKLGVDVGPWEPVLARALALRGSDRHASAAGLLDDLTATVGAADAAYGRGVAARLSSQRSSQRSSQPPPIAAGGGAASGATFSSTSGRSVIRARTARRWPRPPLLWAASLLLLAAASVAWRAIGSHRRAITVVRESAAATAVASAPAWTRAAVPVPVPVTARATATATAAPAPAAAAPAAAVGGLLPAAVDPGARRTAGAVRPAVARRPPAAGAPARRAADPAADPAPRPDVAPAAALPYVLE